VQQLSDRSLNSDGFTALASVADSTERDFHVIASQPPSTLAYVVDVDFPFGAVTQHQLLTRIGNAIDRDLHG
jgi:hypothetical protein